MCELKLMIIVLREKGSQGESDYGRATRAENDTFLDLKTLFSRWHTIH